MSKERLPGAEWRPLPEAGAPDGYNKTQVIYHSIVGTAEGAYGYFLNHTSLESTFIVKLTGNTIQCMNATDRADANSTANYRAISVETEDNGHPDTFPWTLPQCKELIRIGVWAHEYHGVPLRSCRRHDDPGFGYHSMFGAPSPWTPVRGKTCPGIIRIKQYNEIILPGIIAAVNGEEKEIDVNPRDWLQFLYSDKVVFLCNLANMTKEGIETAEAREGIAAVWKLNPVPQRVHKDVLDQFRTTVGGV